MSSDIGMPVLVSVLARGFDESVAGGMKRAAKDVLSERYRQVTKEGYTPEHDDEHVDGEIAEAAAWYAATPRLEGTHMCVTSWWPWLVEPKRKDRRDQLVKAGALILAEIERIDRREAHIAKFKAKGTGDESP